MSRTILSFLTATTLLASLLCAQAQDRAIKASIEVFYGDLDLSKPAGMQTLQRRLKAASAQVCGDTDGALRINTVDQARCARDAMANALAAIGKGQTRMVAATVQKANY
jgi:UrcA family protein